MRRPRHSGDIGLTWFGKKWTGSWATVFVGQRADSDFFTFSRPLTSNPRYTVSNVALTYAVSRMLSFFLRGENLFDRNYQEVLGYQALGRGAVAGAKFHLGGER